MNSSSDRHRIRLQSLFPDRSPPADAWQRLSQRLHTGTERRRRLPPALLASAGVLMVGVVIGLLIPAGTEDLTLEGVTHDPGGSRLFILTDEGRRPVPAERYANLTIYDLDAVAVSTEPNGDAGEDVDR